MQFLHPGYLWFLSLMAIPVVIHLFNFRRYKVLQFSNFRFLQQLQQESDQRNKIKHWLVLAARMLMIACLVMAFAQPFIPFTNQAAQKPSLISVYLDNSFSMRNTNNGVANFELARRKAIEIIKAQSESAQIQVLSASCFGHEQRVLSKKEALQYVEELGIVPASPNWNSILEKQKDVIETNKSANTYCYYLSDFQAKEVNFTAFANDSSIHTVAIPFLANSKANIAIDTCWLAQPIQMQDQASNLLVRIRNYGEDAAENVRLSLTLNNEQKYVGAVSIAAKSTHIDTIPIAVHQTGYTKGLLHINDEPINFDNDYYFTLEVKSSFKVYCIASSNNSAFKALAAGFKNAEFVFSDYNHINYNQIEEADVLILQDATTVNGGVQAAIEKRTKTRGLSLILFPSDKGVEDLNAFLQPYSVQLGKKYSPVSLQPISVQNPFFKDMFRKIDESMEMPSIARAFALNASIQEGVNVDALLKTKEDAPILFAAKKANLTLFVFGFSLSSENSNFSRKALFAPMIAKMMLSSSDSKPLAYDLGASRSIELPYSSENAEVAYHLKSATIDIIPEQRIIGQSLFINIHQQLEKPGTYTLGDKSQAYTLSFNYSRNESAPVEAQNVENWAKAINATVIAADVANAGVVAKQIQEGIHYWQWLLVLALCFILIEIVLLRYWR